MKTWYIAEDNGNILSLSAEREPAWFTFGNRWENSRAEAIDKRRRNLAGTVDRAQTELFEAERKLKSFNNAIATADQS